eukprot:GEMP01055136.1.p1 GENE.GEMP01055136.1~~GEMP01055136.1.p1  ORF type:complete len:218 (+),score=58.54 GEMP01055136.1:256-909(+)
MATRAIRQRAEELDANIVVLRQHIAKSREELMMLQAAQVDDMEKEQIARKHNERIREERSHLAEVLDAHLIRDIEALKEEKRQYANGSLMNDTSCATAEQRISETNAIAEEIRRETESASKRASSIEARRAGHLREKELEVVQLVEAAKTLKTQVLNSAHSRSSNPEAIQVVMHELQLKREALQVAKETHATQLQHEAWLIQKLRRSEFATHTTKKG